MPLRLRLRIYGLVGLSVIASALVLSGCADNLPPRPEPVSPVAAELLALHNDERVYHHVRPLRLDYELTRQAQAHAEWMAATRRLQHEVGFFENIGVGYADASAAMRGWVTSPPHETTVLGQQFTRFGAGMARDPYGVPYWCARFE